MRYLRLTEFATTLAVELSLDERDALRLAVPSMWVRPTVGRKDLYDLTPGSWVGTVRLAGLAIEIRPKIPIDRVLFMLSYALDPTRWTQQGFDYDSPESLIEAIVPGFVTHVRHATRYGLLQGYRTQEEALTTIRGRLRFDDQIRKRYGIFPPAEVRFDEFTEDVEENRLLKAALVRLRRLRIRSDAAKRSLRSFDSALALVEDVSYDPHALPQINFTRLNERYRPAVELAKLILRSSAFELRHGRTAGTSVLFDMNKVFEDFLVVALREELQLGERQFVQGSKKQGLWLDEARAVRLRPDLSWWDKNRCLFVGDAKYKVVNVAGVEHADIYQLLAYTIATELPGGLLVYAAGEGTPNVHSVVLANKRLEVMNLDLSGDSQAILGEVRGIADRIRELARQRWASLAA